MKNFWLKELEINLKIAWQSLFNHWGRTFFSILGIIIGTASIVLVLVFSQGLKKYVIGQVQSFGTDILEIEVKTPKTSHLSSQNVASMAGGSQVTTFKLEEAEKISKLENIAAWYTGTISQSVLSNKEKNKRVMIMGIAGEIEKTDPNFILEEGITFRESNQLEDVIILGNKLKKDLFGEEAKVIGQSVKLKNKNYQVIGILKDRGSTGFFDFDEIAYIPLKNLQKKILGTNHIAFAIYKLKDFSQVETTKLEMTQLMRSFHSIKNPDDDDFAITSIAEAIETLDKIFKAINILLLAITLVSLLVGGVGITNVMYVAVSERAYEIGIRKSIGAKRSDILKQFLIEAVLLTLLGGLLGILLGFLGMKIGEKIINNFGFYLNFSLSFGIVFLSLAFSFIVGVVFGFRPAQKAAQLSPIEAIRKEE